ncbi:MAG: DUF3536 domain-containing protein [Deltaproteobacteria bacterium]|jgi:alpha-amylase/alpha-mannosidase (GH57 family)|nr:DUF3536 domain-containing protein [Deltaproteobacteria bacterium]
MPAQLSSPRLLTVHGHFYQPPRENPWSGAIGRQPSAAPFADWNARINRECYAPNARARLLDEAGRIKAFINNYEHMSFNIGPTLFYWLRRADPETCRLAVQADRAAAARRGGHGSALGQVFNHLIMPLADARDKLTQVRWGRRCFKAAYGREPEGMWLAETAVDGESLAALGQEGLKFTVVAQTQIEAVRPLTAGREAPWTPTDGPADPREPYRVWWGRGPDDHIDVFAYDGPVSRAVAFENLLRDGRALLARVEQAFGRPYADGRPRLVNLATDGESYGHHFRFGDMALAWLHDAVNRGLDEPIELTNYGEFLEKCPPRLEARLVENSSWSCCHGVERWRSDCGCRVGGPPEWNQKWRTPLRDGLNWLRDRLAEIFERQGGRLLRDPWAARDDYVEVLDSDYDLEIQRAFLARHGAPRLSDEGARRALRLLESQLMSLYMFTSCGWFFDDLAGLEPVQNLRYAARAIELAGEWAATDLTEGLAARLRHARPNNAEFPSGEDVWRKLALTAALPSSLSAAHWAAAKLMDVPEALDEFVWQGFEELEAVRTDADGQTSLTGRLALTDPRLGPAAEEMLVAAFCGPGGDEVTVCVGRSGQADAFQAALAAAPPGGQPPAGLCRELEIFALDQLWPSVRQTILSKMVKDFLDDVRGYAVERFSQRRELLLKYARSDSDRSWVDRFVFRAAAEADLRAFIRRLAQGGPAEPAKLAELAATKALSQEPDLLASIQTHLAFLFGQAARRPTALAELTALIAAVKQAGLDVDWWESQNLWQALTADQAFVRGLSDDGRRAFLALGQELGFAAELFTSR